MSKRTLLFIGERRSKRAKRMGVRWRDGALAAVPLFRGLRAAGLDPDAHHFTNLFEYGGIEAAQLADVAGWTIVAMGQKVQRALAAKGVKFVPLIHPAARGAIRKRERYTAHVVDTMRRIA